MDAKKRELMLRELWADGSISAVEISRRMRVSTATVWRLSREYGLPSRIRVRNSKDVLALFRHWNDETLSIREVSRILGFSREHIYRMAKQYGLGRRNYRPAGLGQPDPTPEQIAERAAEIRAKNMEAMKGQAKFVQHPYGGRCYAWSGDHYESCCEVM